MINKLFIFLYYRSSTETLVLNAKTVNKANERTGPGDFQLLKTLGKGGYGKVLLVLLSSFIIIVINNTILSFLIIPPCASHYAIVD